MNINNKEYKIFDNDEHTAYERKAPMPDNFVGKCVMENIELTTSRTSGVPMCKIIWRTTTLDENTTFNHFLPLSDKTPWNRNKLVKQLAVDYYDIRPEKILDRCENDNDELEICQEAISLISKNKNRANVEVNIKREPQRKTENAEKRFFDINILPVNYVNSTTNIPDDDIDLSEML